MIRSFRLGVRHDFPDWLANKKARLPKKAVEGIAAFSKQCVALEQRIVAKMQRSPP
jgi:hypothetical protein